MNHSLFSFRNPLKTNFWETSVSSKYQQGFLSLYKEKVRDPRFLHLQSFALHCIKNNLIAKEKIYNPITILAETFDPNKRYRSYTLTPADGSDYYEELKRQIVADLGCENVSVMHETGTELNQMTWNDIRGANFYSFKIEKASGQVKKKQVITQEIILGEEAVHVPTIDNPEAFIDWFGNEFEKRGYLNACASEYVVNEHELLTLVLEGTQNTSFVTDKFSFTNDFVHLASPLLNDGIRLLGKRHRYVPAKTSRVAFIPRAVKKSKRVVQKREHEEFRSHVKTFMNQLTPLCNLIQKGSAQLLGSVVEDLPLSCLPNIGKEFMLRLYDKENMVSLQSYVKDNSTSIASSVSYNQIPENQPSTDSKVNDFPVYTVGTIREQEIVAGKVNDLTITDPESEKVVMDAKVNDLLVSVPVITVGSMRKDNVKDDSVTSLRVKKQSVTNSLFSESDEEIIGDELTCPVHPENSDEEIMEAMVIPEIENEIENELDDPMIAEFPLMNIDAGIVDMLTFGRVPPDNIRGLTTNDIKMFGVDLRPMVGSPWNALVEAATKTFRVRGPSHNATYLAGLIYKLLRYERQMTPKKEDRKVIDTFNDNTWYVIIPTDRAYKNNKRALEQLKSFFYTANTMLFGTRTTLEQKTTAFDKIRDYTFSFLVGKDQRSLLLKTRPAVKTTIVNYLDWEIPIIPVDGGKFIWDNGHEVGRHYEGGVTVAPIPNIIVQKTVAPPRTSTRVIAPPRVYRTTPIVPPTPVPYEPPVPYDPSAPYNPPPRSGYKPVPIELITSYSGTVLQAISNTHFERIAREIDRWQVADNQPPYFSQLLEQTPVTVIVPSNSGIQADYGFDPLKVELFLKEYGADVIASWVLLHIFGRDLPDLPVEDQTNGDLYGNIVPVNEQKSEYYYGVLSPLVNVGNRYYINPVQASNGWVYYSHRDLITIQEVAEKMKRSGIQNKMVLSSPPPNMEMTSPINYFFSALVHANLITSDPHQTQILLVRANDNGAMDQRMKEILQKDSASAAKILQNAFRRHLFDLQHTNNNYENANDITMHMMSGDSLQLCSDGKDTFASMIDRVTNEPKDNILLRHQAFMHENIYIIPYIE